MILVFLLLNLFGEGKVWGQCTPGEPVIISLNSVGQDSFTIPTGVTSIRVQVWGAGGRGGTRTNNGEGGGGGGGAYSESTIAVTPGTNYTAFVGRGSDTEEDGQDSWLSTSSNSSNAVVLAKGGESVGNNKDAGKKGGKNNGIGSIRYSGGDGGDGKDDNGGGGGSSASPDGNGRNGEDGDDGSSGGEARNGGGSGGNGQNNISGDGDPGIEPGGGGGGSTRNGSGTRIGGKGGNGKLIISYICPSCGLNSTFSASIQQFIVPAGVTQITMKAWGGGGKGGNRISNDGSSGGGGAGAYSESTITVTPGETLYYFSGAGSSPTNAGGDSWVSRASDGSNPFILAKKGNSVANNVTNGGSGGLASQGVGTIKTAGGNGSDANGNGGDGGNSPNGGDGGDGGDGNGNSNGDPGESPGGGGGGAKTNGNNNQSGGSGGNGQITFSYSCEVPVDPPGGGCWRYVDDGSISGIVIIEFFENCTWNAPQGLLEFEVLAIGGGGGGGAHSGGGGGSGGIVHGKVDIEVASVFGLLAYTPFEILIGAGGLGSPADNKKADDGKNSIFNSAGTFHSTAGGVYQITAGGGGGGGSDSGGGGNASGKGNTGFLSSKSNETNMSQLTLYNGSGGGASHPNNNGGGGQNRKGGNGSTHSGGGGGGVLSSGDNGNTSLQGGTGGTGQQFNQFDKNLQRFFSGGGGGGSEASYQAPGGSGAGGNGAFNGPGQTGKTPGSGGGGGGHSGDERGGNGAKGVVFVKYEIARILPVEYLYFKADYNSFMRSGELSWSTAKEWENSHFQIERSINDVKSWESIGQIQSAGFSDRPMEYTYQDQKLPLGGGNIFYRLKQFDFEGNSTYSVTKSIQINPVTGTTYWTVYPNPTTADQINLELYDTREITEDKITVRIISVTGQWDVIESDSAIQLSDQLSSLMRNRSTGIYTLEIKWGDKQEYHKVILRR